MSDELNGIKYVEPNLIHNIVDTKGNIHEATPNQEDYCIMVNLGVNVTENRYAAKVTTNDENNIIMTWDGMTKNVNFMAGSKLYSNPSTKSGTYVNALTTDYSDLCISDYLRNPKEYATTEMFGIESIDINYDNYYVPQVTIRFIDIRGFSLFMPEEMRHNVSSNGIDAIANENIAGSFFKSFFTFPYPMFRLTVKGLYGQPIAFDLSVVDWKADFDCSQGSFGCTVNFIGYTYALLSDLTLNACIAASEDTSIGANYFKSSKHYFDNGQEIMSFPQFWEKFKLAKNSNEKIASESQEAKLIAELGNRKEILQRIDNAYSYFITKCYDFLSSNKDTNIQIIMSNDDRNGDKNTNVYFFVNKESGVLPQEIINAINELKLAIEQDKSVINNSNKTFKYWGDNATDISGIDKSSILNDAEFKGNVDGYQYMYAFIANNIKDNLKKILDANEARLVETNKKLTLLVNQNLTSILGFNPNVENFIRLMCKHIDTLIHCICTTSNSANENSSNRDLSKFNRSDFRGEESRFVPAFPKCVKENKASYLNTVEEENFNKIEDSWIGDALGNDCAEANLINGILEGIGTINTALSDIDTVFQNDDNNVSQPYKVKYPITPYDYIIDDIMFNDSNITDITEIINRIALRGFTILSSIPCYGLNNKSSFFGKLDAINFYNLTKDKVSNKFKKLMQCNNPINFVNYKVTGKNYPWGKMDLFYKKGSNYIINKNFKFFKFKDTDSYYLPLKNVNMSKLKYISQCGSEVLTYNMRDLASGRRKFLFNIMTDSESSSIKEHNSIITFDDENDYQIYSDIYGNMTLSEDDIANKLYANNNDSESVDDIASSLAYKGFNEANNLFGLGEYYDKNINEKAEMFLSIFADDNSLTEYTTWIGNDNKPFMPIPKVIILRIGALLTLNRLEIKAKDKSPIREDIIKTIKEFYNNWLNNEFKTFLKKLEIPNDVVRALKTNTSKNIDFLDEIWSNSPYIIDKTLSKGNLGNKFIIKMSLNKFKADIKTFMFESVLVAKVNKHVTNKYIPSANISSLESYCNAFKKQLGLLYSQENENLNINKVDDAKSSKDSKIALYNYIKLIYDRWLCGKDNTSSNFDWSFNNLFNKFIFIDSLYFKIGKHLQINIESLFKRLESSLTQETYSVASFINDVLSDNNMLFLSIQNFADLSDDTLFQQVFTPIPYNKIGLVKPQTNFVCLYTYAKSNNLNIPNSQYVDDGFMLNDKEQLQTYMPYLLDKNVGENGYTIPAFGVSYGKQYQSYFTAIHPTMESPIVTEQVLKTQFILASKAKDTSQKINFYGQDLYTIYGNNSYACDVEMLGCAWIQPLMYFTLNNVPMFRGSYLIHKVSHSITNGTMKTKFTGTRMNRYCTPFSKQWAETQNNDENGNFDGKQKNKKQIPNTVNSCQYDIYSPNLEASKNANGLDYYNNTKLQDLGIETHPEWTLRQAITNICIGEALNEGALGMALVATVIYNRSKTTSWKNILNKNQFNAFGLREDTSTNVKLNTNDKLNCVDMILTYSPQVLIGKVTDPPTQAFRAYSQDKLINENYNEARELTYDNLSKIYMFNNIYAYSKAPCPGLNKPNPIKATIFGFAHKNHIFHFGPNADSDKPLWTINSNSTDNTSENLLSTDSSAYGLYQAIKKTCLTSSNANFEIVLVEGSVKIKNNLNQSTEFAITCEDKSKLHIAFDAILDSYSEYCNTIQWVMNNSNDYLSSNPNKIRIVYGNGNPNKKVYIGYNDTVDGLFTIDDFNNDKKPLNDNFCSSIAKHYNSKVSKFQNECANFLKKDAQEILEILKEKYPNNCSEGSSSIYPNNDEFVDGDNLPQQIEIPVKPEGTDLRNLSGVYNEPRNNHMHQGIDIGVCHQKASMVACLPGKVVYTQDNPSYGYIIIIKHDCGTNKGVLYTRYLHGISNIKVGTIVDKGTVIGDVAGVSGYAPHLHFEMSFINGEFTYKKFLDGLVDPQKLYYFGEKGKRLLDFKDKLGKKVC